MGADLLPSSLPRVIRNRTWREGMWWVPIYCANCGCDGGQVPEAAVEDQTFCFYLCEPCYATHGKVADTMTVPVEAFWQKVKEAQLESFGRELQPHEIVEALKDEHHPLTKLARDRQAFK